MEQYKFFSRLDAGDFHDRLLKSGFEKFSKNDWYTYGGCPKVKGKDPLIYHADKFDIIFDGDGIGLILEGGEQAIMPMNTIDFM